MINTVLLAAVFKGTCAVFLGDATPPNVVAFVADPNNDQSRHHFELTVLEPGPAGGTIPTVMSILYAADSETVVIRSNLFAGPSAMAAFEGVAVGSKLSTTTPSRGGRAISCRGEVVTVP